MKQKESKGAFMDALGDVVDLHLKALVEYAKNNPSATLDELFASVDEVVYRLKTKGKI